MSVAITQNMDDRRKAGGYLLPYQTRWVFDTSRFGMCEKSIRIGITYAQEFVAVRERLIPGEGDYLHSSVTQGVANQFIQECEFWIDLYRKGGAVLARDTMEYVDEEVDPRTQEIIRVRKKAFSLKFDTGQRIVSFSSSPSAIRGFGGNVGLDEIAFHGNMAEMMKAAGGQAMWGYGVRLWSSHNGVGSDFNAKLEEERAKGDASRWSIHRITLLDAIEDGLVEKINSTRGLNMTRDEFIAQTKELCGSIAAFEEECMCNPRERGLPLVSWHDLTWARKEYEITRVHVEGDAGMNDMMDPAAVRLIGERLWQLLDGDSRYCLGYDVARTGHLSAIPLLRREGPGRYRLVMLITMHNCKFASQREFIVDLMSHARNIVGAGDSTGAGMQVCEELQDRFGARFSGINFGTYKPELGTVLQRTCEDHALLLPAAHEHEDIVHDIHGIKVDPGATRMRFTESKNPGNALSHCDIAWGIGLALFADDGDTGDVMGEVAAMAATGAALSGHADRAGWHRPDNSDDFVRANEEGLVVLYDAYDRPLSDNRPPTAGRGVHWEPGDRESTDVSRGLTPTQVGAIMARANTGDTQDQSRLAMEIEEKNWDIGHAVATRRLAVAGCEWELIPGDDGDKAKSIADRVDKELRQPYVLSNVEDTDIDTFEEAMAYALMGALLPGFAVVEIVWGAGGASIDGYVEIEQRHFTHTDSRSPLLVTRDHPEGVPLDPRKFIVHRYRVRGGDPGRGGLIRPLAWLDVFQRLGGMKDLMRFIERYGMPFLVARVGAAAWERERNRIKYLIQNFGPNGGAVFSTNVETELIQAANAGGDVYWKLLEYTGDAITKLILGQTATSGDAGGLSKGQAQENVRMDILRADCKALSATITARLIRPFVLFNYGPDAPVPRLRYDCEPEEDMKPAAEIIGLLANAGYAVDPAQIEERFGWRVRPAGRTEGSAAGTQTGGTGSDGGDGGDGQADEPAIPEEMQEEIKRLALNGAQVSALIGVIQEIAARKLPRDTGIRIISRSFGLDPAEVEKLVGSVGRTFFIEDGSQSLSDTPIGPASAEDTSGEALAELLAGRGLDEWFGPLQAAIDAALAGDPDEAQLSDRLRNLVDGMPALLDEMDSTTFEELLERVLHTERARGAAATAAKLT